VSKDPRLTIGLPVYNGENYLAESIEALLGQTYEDFELIIADNASTDSTADICRRYEQQDSRVRHLRHPVNIGLARNHNCLVYEGRGELFKWASHDDLYGRDLIRLCVDALDERPDVVLAHSWTALIDGSSQVSRALRYTLDTASPSPPVRFKSMLFERGGDDDSGVIRMPVLKQTALNGSYYRADRTFVTELALAGPFYHVPDWLYFRRDHPDRAARAFTSVRDWCANLDPRRANRLRNPAVRLYGEYVWGFISAINRAPLSAAERVQCYKHLARWAASRALSERGHFVSETAAAEVPPISLDDVVAGQRSRVR
jgi:glycosyltransferase involved in cell wall biosynthesis